MKKLTLNETALLSAGSACSSNPVETAVCFAENCLVFGLVNHVISVVINGTPINYSCTL